ncbi:MAG: ankyrin repeat domain-containing protein [Rickettsia endosymbiont of Pentastiridius leporinus]
MAKPVNINPEANYNKSLHQADTQQEFDLINKIKENKPIEFTEQFFELKSTYRDLLDQNNESLVMIAVKKAINDPKYIEGILTTLIAFEYETNILDATNRTPLYVAAAAGNKAIVEKLLTTDIKRIDKHHSEHGTALFASIKNGYLEIAELLLIKGADINIQPFPIKDLIKNNNIETLSYFIEFSKSNYSIIKPF